MAKKAKSLLNADLFRKPLFWLILVTFLGGCFRFYNPNWDYHHYFHPDERNISNAVAQCQSEPGYRVHFFAYGQLPAYLYTATAYLISSPFGVESWFFQVLYWLFLLALFSGIVWLFFQEKWDWPAFEVSISFFLAVFFLKFLLLPISHNSPDTFTAWFSALDGQQIHLNFLSSLFNISPGISSVACFLVTVLVSFGVSALVSKILELEWSGLPFYIACGTTFLLGMIPGFLPEDMHLPRIILTFLFILLVAVAAGLLAWASRLGRLLLVVFSAWTILASLPHGGGAYTSNDDIMIVGRVWSAVFSTSTIVAIYFLVKRIYGNLLMALLASASFAFAVVSIEQAHYCITESFITFMFVVVALCSHQIIKDGSWRSYLWAGAAFGFAMAAKTSALYYVLLLVTAHLVFLSGKSAQEWEREGRKQKENADIHSILAGMLLAVVLLGIPMIGLSFKGVFRDLFERMPDTANALWIVLQAVLLLAGVLFFLWGLAEFKVLRSQMPQWIRLTAAGGVSFFVFFLFSPWSLLDYPKFMESMNYEWSVVSQASACYVLQFKDTPRYLYHLKNLMSVELWWPLGVTAVLGMVWVLGRFAWRLFQPVKGRYLLPLPFARGKGWAFSLPDLLILCWFIPYFGFIGSWNTKFIRYMAPVIPAFCIFAARLLADLFEWAKKIPIGKFLKPALCLLVLGPSLFYSMAYMHVYRFQHPWIESSVWIYKNVPFGSKIFNEAWGDGLPVDINPSQDPRVDRLMSPGLYQSRDVTPYEMHGFPTDNSAVKKNYYANLIPQGDYISISSKKLWYTLTDETPEFRPNEFNVYPVTSRYYRCLWSGLLGYKMVAEIHNFPSLFGWEHPDDMAEESFSVYDHPRVYLFKKIETITPEKILKLLETDDYVKGVNRDIMRTITPDNVDAFIAERHQYLESHGLLAQLEEAVPTPTPVETPAPVSTKPSRKSKLLPAAAAAELTPQPTPEIKVDAPSTVPGLPDARTLQTLADLSKNPVLENEINGSSPAPEESFLYQVRAWGSWVLLLVVLGWLALPLTLRVLSVIPGGAYSLSKALGLFIFSWFVWILVQVHVFHFTVGSCWICLVFLAALSAFGYYRDGKNLKAAWKTWGRVWMIQEAAFIGAFLLFTLVKIYFPNIHDPGGEGYNGGGEAGMDFGFLASIVRGDHFPPQNMWMAGQPIGYSYYFGHLIMGVLTKVLGLVPALTYNLALITLFAAIFSCAFGLAYGLSGSLAGGWIAGLLCALAGNPAGARQYLTAIQQCLTNKSFAPLFDSIYEFFGPSRVIPGSYNEFPYFSVVYGDMHPHTLAQPFGLFFIAVIAAFYMAKPLEAFSFNQKYFTRWFSPGTWLWMLLFGFLLGGMAFLNTWEAPVWLGLILLVQMVKSFSTINAKILSRGLGLLLAVLTSAYLLLGWWAWANHANDPLFLGGEFKYFKAFTAAGVLIGLGVLLLDKRTRVMGRHLISQGLYLAGIVLLARILWAPFFNGLVLQQSELIWVLPKIRTTLSGFLSIYGLFLCALLLSFIWAYGKKIQGWITLKPRVRNFDDLADKGFSAVEGLLNPGGPVEGMTALGVATLALIVCASWAHWTDPPDKAWVSLLFATLTAVSGVLTLVFRDRLEFLLGTIGSALLWIMMMAMHLIALPSDTSVLLELGLFSVLWLLGFIYLGIAVKNRNDRKLSYSYLLVSLFFLVLAGIEVFAVKEYLGGDLMRTNTVFKFGIVAWEIAAVCAGIFFPKIFAAFRNLSKIGKKESGFFRGMTLLLAGATLFAVVKLFTSVFFENFPPGIIPVIDIVLASALLTWWKMKDWLSLWLTTLLGSVAALLLLIPLFPAPAYGTFWSWIHSACDSFATETFFPLLLTIGIAALALFLMEKNKNAGRLLTYYSWMALTALLVAMVSVYPLAASARKGHWFWRGGYNQRPSLNGLAYIDQENPYDAAAMRFLNERVPDQPCLVEFVGEGYNSWGSRFSIFTGVPALMGWDGHVREWLTGRPGMDADISQRFQATEQIFRQTDTLVAKKVLDAYGVRLVMVGTVEKNGVPGRKGGYPAEGLAKFPGFLPLIYKNPQVEIYYNSPSEDQSK